jgi:hypothetical protein
LGPASLHAQGPNVRANFFLNLLHSSQFGRTLVKSIQVISCTRRTSSRRCARVSVVNSNFLKEIDDEEDRFLVSNTRSTSMQSL